MISLRFQGREHLDRRNSLSRLTLSRLNMRSISLVTSGSGWIRYSFALFLLLSLLPWETTFAQSGAPGGIGSGSFGGGRGRSRVLHLWLKADGGTANLVDGQAVTHWSDFSGLSNDASEALNPPVFRNNPADNINFYPTIDFDGVDDQLTASLAALEGDSRFAFYAVVLRENDSDNPVLGSDLTDQSPDSFAYGFGDRSFHFNASSPATPLVSEAIPAFDDPAPIPVLLEGTENGGSLELNGASFTLSDTSNTGFPDATEYYVGRSDSSYFRGRISEIVVYYGAVAGLGNLTQQVRSYLALKYGISLGQNQGAQNYLDSNGGVIWDSSLFGAAYGNGITAIGRDDGSDLVQSQSKSANSDAMVTIGGSGGSITDLNFLFWSHDGGSKMFTDVDTPSGIERRLARSWVIQEVGEVGTVDLTFDLTGFEFLGGGTPAASSFFLLTDPDGTFASGASTLAATSLANNQLTFTGVAGSVLSHGTRFTLSCVLGEGKSAPGGVADGIHLWLNAGAGTSTTTDGATLARWNDLSGGQHHAIEGTNPPVFKNNPMDNINFHPVVEFDGVNDQLVTSLAALEGSSDYSFFAVSVPDDAGTRPVLGADTAADFYLGYQGNGFEFLVGRLGGAGLSPVVASVLDSPGVTPTLLGGISQQHFLEGNGELVAVFSNGNQTFPDLTDYFIGRNQNEHFLGRIGEVIVFNRQLDPVQTARVKSYLAMKYGISLGQTHPQVGSQPYVDSGGNVIWDASTVASGYHQGITAIGRDDVSGLNQTTSKSGSSDAVITLGVSGGGQLADGTFLFWSHDGAARTFSGSDVPSGIFQRLNREWVLESTGQVDPLDVTFDLTGISLPFSGDLDLGSFCLLTDDDGTFAAGSACLTASTISGSLVTFAGVPANTLSDGTYFTLGFRRAPGGVPQNLKLWLKADAGTSTNTDGMTLTGWEDQSGFSNDASELTNPPIFRDNVTDNVNFNPAIDFDGTDDQLLISLEALEGSSDYSFFAVCLREDSSTNPVLGSDLSRSQFFVGFDSFTDPFSGILAGLFNLWVASSSSSSEVVPSFDDPAVTPSLIGGFGNQGFLERDGIFRSFSLNQNRVFPNAMEYFLGRWNTEYFRGRICEVIAYDGNLSATEANRVKSYLAIKYGISLGQVNAHSSDVDQNFLSSDGSVIWDAQLFGGAFDQGITAIGQDDGTGLDQSQSRNGRSDAIVTIAENGGGMHSGEFLFWSNDSGSAAFSEMDVPGGVDQRLGRRWVIQETGDVGSVDITFDLTGFTFVGTQPTATNFYLITDGDGTFASGASTRVASSFAGNQVRFSNVEGSVLGQGTYFTLGCAFGDDRLVGPGGVAQDIHLWLRADMGTSTTADGDPLTMWSDLSGLGNHATENTNPPIFRNNPTNNFNFNPTIEFDGTDDHLKTSLAALEGRSDYSFFAVTDTASDGNTQGPVLGSDLDRFFLGLYLGTFNFSVFSSQGASFAPSPLDPLMGSPAALMVGINDRGILERHGTREEVTSNNEAFPDASEYYVGRFTDQFLDGRISEVIVYNGQLDAGQEARVTSYLAMKYGISLSQDHPVAGMQPYVDSSGNVIWNASAVASGFDNQITAIGRDNDSGLNQTLSKNANTGALVTIGVSGGAELEDREFLFWSHNEGAVEFTGDDVPDGMVQRLTREWVVQETGEVGDVDVTFGLGGVPLPTNLRVGAANFYLLVDDDGTFATGVGSTHPAASYENDQVTFVGIGQDVLDDAKYFTLGFLQAPGGFTDGVLLWLKADELTSLYTDGGDVTVWNDFSGNSNHALGATNPPVFRNNATDNINFSYPTVDFNGLNSHLVASLQALGGSTDVAFYAVCIPEDDDINPVLGSSLSPALFSFGFGKQDGKQTFDFSISSVGDSLEFTVFEGFSNLIPTAIHMRLFGGAGFNHSIVRDHENFGKTIANIGAFPTDETDYFVGRMGGEYFNGRICEVIVYNSPRSSVSIHSYLAIKYGMLDVAHSIAEPVFNDSSGVELFHRHTVAVNFGSFTSPVNEVAAIGRDDVSGLDQPRSKFSNGEAIVTIASNTGEISDRQFLFWANNAGSPTFNPADVPSGIDQRLGRTWHVQETGEVGSVDVSFDVGGISLPSGVSAADHFFLLIGPRLSLESGGAIPASSYSGGVVSFTGLSENALENNVFFSLGVDANQKPTAVDDTVVRIPGSGGVKVYVPTLLGNDSDPDGDTVALMADQLPAASANGSLLSLLPGGRWILYEPAASAPVTDDTFTYEIQDVHGATDNATVTITTEVRNAQTANVRAEISGDDIAVRFQGIPGRRYKIQVASNLSPPISWMDTGATLTAGPRGRLDYMDVGGAVGQVGSRFFRTVVVDE